MSLIDYVYNEYEFLPDEMEELRNAEGLTEFELYQMTCRHFNKSTEVWYIRKDIGYSVLNNTTLIHASLLNVDFYCSEEQKDKYGTFENLSKFIQDKLDNDDIFEFGYYEDYDDMLIITKDDEHKCYWAIYHESSWHAAVIRIDYCDITETELFNQALLIKDNINDAKEQIILKVKSDKKYQFTH
jgi:hypothetical protein